MTFSIGTPHTKNAGYFKNDDTCSGGKLSQADVQTCKHCQAIIKMQEWKTEGGWCAKCESPLCSNPLCMAETAKFGCVPFVKKLERYIETTVRLEQHLRIAGLETTPEHRAEIIVP